MFYMEGLLCTKKRRTLQLGRIAPFLSISSSTFGSPQKKNRKYRFLSRCDLHVSSLSADNFSGQMEAKPYAFLLTGFAGAVKSPEDFRELFLGNTSSVINYINSVKKLISPATKENRISPAGIFDGIIQKIPQGFLGPLRVKPGQI